MDDPTEGSRTTVDGVNGRDGAVEQEGDIWASPSGYTPLESMPSSTTTTMLSVGPDHEGGGAFFADLRAFTSFLQEEEDDEHEYSDIDDRKESGPQTEEVEIVDDFRAVADQALMALEDEYRLTVQGGGNIDDKASIKTKVEEDEPLPPIRLPAEDFPDFFVTDFDKSPDETFEMQETARPLPEIDTTALTRAVEAINLRDPNLKTNFAEWELMQKEQLASSPQVHPIIPSMPLAAFAYHKNSPKAVNATNNLSRCATIAEALRRLDLLRGQECFRIDVVGCDHVECASPERIRKVFDPIIRWIGAYSEAPKQLQLCLVGPNVPRQVEGVLDFQDQLGRLEKATAVCSTVVYEDFHAESTDRLPDLAIAFNAGIWGYKEWKTTIRFLADLRKRIPFVATAYTLQEAEDDAAEIQECLGTMWDKETVKSACLWDAEFNAFRSKQERETQSAAPGRRYRENAAWQAWRL